MEPKQLTTDQQLERERFIENRRKEIRDCERSILALEQELNDARTRLSWLKASIRGKF